MSVQLRSKMVMVLPDFSPASRCLVKRERRLLLCAILILQGSLFLYYLTLASATRTINVYNYWHNSSKYQGLARHSLFLMKNDQDLEVNKIVRNRRTNGTKDHKCIKKIFNVSFLKVHKAGSTTVMNIFIRFAINYNLNIVLPRKSNGTGFNYLGRGKTVARENVVPILANESYNILCNHAVYNREAFHSILPKDTVYIGIIREPVSHFSSAALYFGFYKHIRNLFQGKLTANKVVSYFLKKPLQVKRRLSFVNNRMSFDFGIPKHKFHSDKFVETYIEDLDQDFSLVLVLEHFQESLVLMKRTLCWDTKDILYVKLNANKKTPQFHLDSKDIENLRKWNSADFILYEHFYKVFVAKVELYGEDFKREVESFKSIQQDVHTFCNKVVKEGNTTSIFTVSETKWGNGFIITMGDCKLMTESELPMMKRLIKNAWSRYHASIAKSQSSYE